MRYKPSKVEMGVVGTILAGGLVGSLFLASKGDSHNIDKNLLNPLYTTQSSISPSPYGPKEILGPTPPKNLEEVVKIKLNFVDPILALTAIGYLEAGGYSDTERILTMYSALNRLNLGTHGENLTEVLLEYCAYTPLINYDPLKGWTLKLSGENLEAWDRCSDLAKSVCSGEIPDPSNGATHFFNPKLVTEKKRDQFRNGYNLTKIGRIKTETGKLTEHEFYKEKVSKNQKGA